MHEPASASTSEALGPLSAAELCKQFQDWLQAFVAGSPQWDDITLVVLKLKPE
jgi:serine phosphatase RsbU (regulator of sigma subunit)